jgi:hypothetical protein
MPLPEATIDGILEYGAQSGAGPLQTAKALRRWQGDMAKYAVEEAEPGEGLFHVDRDVDTAVEGLTKQHAATWLQARTPDARGLLERAKQASYDPAVMGPEDAALWQELDAEVSQPVFQPVRREAVEIDVGGTKVRAVARHGGDAMEVLYDLPDGKKRMARVPAPNDEDVQGEVAQVRTQIEKIKAFDKVVEKSPGLSTLRNVLPKVPVMGNIITAGAEATDDPVAAARYGGPKERDRRMAQLEARLAALQKGGAGHVMRERLAKELQDERYDAHFPAAYSPRALGGKLLEGLASATLKAKGVVDMTGLSDVKTTVDARESVSELLPSGGAARARAGFAGRVALGATESTGEMLPALVGGAASRGVASAQQLAAMNAGRLGVMGATMAAQGVGGAFEEAERAAQAVEATDPAKAERIRRTAHVHALVSGAIEGLTERLGGAQMLKGAKGVKNITGQLATEGAEEAIAGGAQRGLVDPMTLERNEAVYAPMVEEAVTGMVAAGPTVLTSTLMNRGAQPEAGPAQAVASTGAAAQQGDGVLAQIQANEMTAQESSATASASSSEIPAASAPVSEASPILPATGLPEAGVLGLPAAQESSATSLGNVAEAGPSTSSGQPSPPVGVVAMDATGLLAMGSVIRTMARQAKDFASWSADMLRQFGEWVTPHLKQLWAAARDAAEDVLMGYLAKVGAVRYAVPQDKMEGSSSGAGATAAAVLPAARAAAGLPPGERAPKEGEATETRSFGARVAEDPRMNPKVQAQAAQEYVPIQNVETLGQANAIIDQMGLPAAAAMVRDAGAPIPAHVRVALGMQVMLRLDQAARAARNAGDTAGAAAMWQQVGEIGSYVDSLGTEAGRAVQAFAMWARMTPEGMLASFEKRVRDANDGTMPALPPEVLTKLGDLRNKVNALPENSPLRADMMREMLNEMAHYEGIPLRSVFAALWYANLLSGLTTQGMNVIGNGFALTLRTVAAGMVNHPSDSLRMLQGFMRGLPRAWAEAWAAWKGNVDSRNTQDAPTIGDHVKRSALEIMLSRPPSDWKSWVAWVGSVGGLTKYVSRLMTGMDAAFYYTAAEGRAHLAASRAARKGRVPGTPEFVQAMAAMLGRGEAEWAAALQDAVTQLVTSGREVTQTEKLRIAYAMLDAKRPVEIREEAGRFGELVTAQQEPEGLGQWIYEMARGFQRLPVLGRVLLPFARILANLTSNALDFTPVGMVRGLRGKHLVNPQREFASWERKERAAASVLGTTAMLYVLAKAMEHEEEDDVNAPFMIYGFGPQSKTRRDQMPKGWKPYTIKIGRHYVSYAETPLVFALAPIGGLMDARRYQKNLDERSQADRFAYYTQAVLKTGLSQGVMSSLGDALGMMNGDVPITKLPSRMTSGIIPGHGFLRDVTALFDPVKISDDSVAASILRDVPVARHWYGHPARDYMGDVITYDGLARIPVVKRFVTDQRDTDKEKGWVGQMRLSIPAFPKVIEVGDYLTAREKLHARAARIDAGMLTAQEQDRFVELAGQMTRKEVGHLKRQYEDLRGRGKPLPSQEKLQRMLDAKVRAVRTVAMRVLMKG